MMARLTIGCPEHDDPETDDDPCACGHPRYHHDDGEGACLDCTCSECDAAQTTLTPDSHR